MKRLFAVLLIAHASFSAEISAAARSFQIKASPSAEQTTRYDQGRQMLISRKINSGVAITFFTESYNPGVTIDFGVAVKNDFKNSTNFSTESIGALCDNNKSLHIFYPEEALRDQEKRTDVLNPSDLAGVSISDIQALTPQLKKYYEKRNQELQEFSSHLLKAQTIELAGTYEGIARMAFPKCKSRLVIKATIGDDTHSFVFEVKEQ